MNYRILDFIILVMMAIFFVGVLSFEYSILSLQNPIIPIPYIWKPLFDFLLYPIVILLMADLALKYRKEKNLKKFVKTYWIDITMLTLIPVFSIFKFFKMGLSFIKQLKILKMGTKTLHKTKKITKK